MALCQFHELVGFHAGVSYDLSEQSAVDGLARMVRDHGRAAIGMLHEYVASFLPDGLKTGPGQCTEHFPCRQWPQRHPPAPAGSDRDLDSLQAYDPRAPVRLFLGGIEIKAYRFTCPPHEDVEAFRLRVAAGKSGHGGDEISVLAFLYEDVEDQLPRPHEDIIAAGDYQCFGQTDHLALFTLTVWGPGKDKGAVVPTTRLIYIGL